MKAHRFVGSLRALVVALALLALAAATVGAGSAAAAVPTVSGFAPASGPPGWSVTLTGTGFAETTAVTITPTNLAYMPQSALFTAQDDTTIVATVPLFDTVPLDATITVATPDGSTIAPGAFLIDGQVAISEHRGSSGEPVVLTGSGFTAATAVTFGTWPTQTDGAFALVNSVNAKFSVQSDTEIAATVPALRPGKDYWVEVDGPTATSVSEHSAPFLVVVPRLLNDSTGKFLVRPATLMFGATGQFLVGKLPHHKGHGIRWRRWGTVAQGTATVWIDVSVPAYLGHFIGCKGTVTASRLRGGRYTRLAVTWRQNGRTKVERFKLRLWADGSRWGWF
jgi:hypothetical protein